MTNQSRSNYLTLNKNDNVAVAIIDLPPGHPLETGNIVVKAAIPAGHKVATAKIFSGDAIIKYGQIIGFATSDIVAGDHVHSHNCSMKDFDRDYAFGMNIPNTKMVAPSDRLTFEGFRRPTVK